MKSNAIGVVKWKSRFQSIATPRVGVAPDVSTENVIGIEVAPSRAFNSATSDCRLSAGLAVSRSIAESSAFWTEYWVPAVGAPPCQNLTVSVVGVVPTIMPVEVPATTVRNNKSSVKCASVSLSVVSV